MNICILPKQVASTADCKIVTNVQYSNALSAFGQLCSYDVSTSVLFRTFSFPLPPCNHHIRVMPVELKGSCHCGAVAFTVQSSTPVPYQLCMCSICRKVGGTGGSVNLGAHAHTLQITKGKADISCVILSYTLRCSYMFLTVRGGTGYIKQY